MHHHRVSNLELHGCQWLILEPCRRLMGRLGLPKRPQVAYWVSTMRMHEVMSVHKGLDLT